jgi:hypothetical protein
VTPLTSSDSRTAPDGVRSFRLGALQRALPLALGFLGGTALVAVPCAVAGEPLPAGEAWQLTGWALFGVAFATLLQRGRGVQLTADALVVARGRRRRIPWADIARLEVRRVAGVSQVVVHTRDGRSTVLPAPNSFRDARFEEKTRESTRWWLERRQDLSSG